MKALWSRLQQIKHIDKFNHFSLCFILALFSWEFSAGWAIGKETGDYFNPNSKWSWWDLVADAFGIVTGLLIKHYLL